MNRTLQLARVPRVGDMRTPGGPADWRGVPYAMREGIAMRDPELVMRAQRAAAELERAWDRWRTIHGLGTEPPPPVSSYVGYSLEEPWGQPRVVFGIDAREAEHLAALLDRHDFAGPIYASVASRPGARPAEEANGRPAEPSNGHVHVPTQAQAAAVQRDPAPRDHGRSGPAASTAHPARAAQSPGQHGASTRPATAPRFPRA